MSEKRLVLPHRKQVMSLWMVMMAERGRGTWRGLGSEASPGLLMARRQRQKGRSGPGRPLAWLARGRRVLASEKKMKPDKEEQACEQNIESTFRLFCVKTAT